MGDPTSSFKTAVQTLAAERRSATHPTPDQLLAYHEGELRGEAMHRLQDHLAVCPQCANTVLEMALFPEIEATGVDPAAGLSIESEIAAFYRRLGRERRVIHRFAALRAVALPLAAMLALAVLGLTLDLFFLHKSLREQRGEIARLDSKLRQEVAGGWRNFEIHSLLPLEDSELRGSEEEPYRLRIDAGPVILALNHYTSQSFDDHRVEILDGSGDIVWAENGFTQTSANNYTLNLPEAARTPGIYEIRLVGLLAGSRELLASYWIRVEPR